MGIGPTYQIAFFFREGASISLSKISEILKGKGERTFKVQNEKIWVHEYGKGIERRDRCEVIWDNRGNILVATIHAKRISDTKDIPRTCGSLVEWMLRNVGGQMRVGEQDLKAVSVEVLSV